MLGMKTCAMCKHFKGLTELDGKQRVELIHEVMITGKDPENHGICTVYNKVVHKWDGGDCPEWEVKIW